jgi:uncharacterized protein
MVNKFVGVLIRGSHVKIGTFMEYQINSITIGVSDLKAMKRWYQQKLEWIPFRESHDSVTFRISRMLLVLVQEDTLAQRLSQWQDGSGFKRFVMTLGFGSEQEVDNAFSELRQKGVSIVKKPARDAFGAYKGYISDPEENYWELAFYPSGRLGKIELPGSIWQEKLFSKT